MKQMLLSILTILFLNLGCGTGHNTKETDDGMVEYHLVFRAKKVQLTNLMCYYCFNGDDTNDCMTLNNKTNIRRHFCKKGENYCKVERTLTEGVLTTFDRYCSSHCQPGCREASIYQECVSCCNHKSLCNTDTFSGGHGQRTDLRLVTINILGSFILLFSVYS